jgi:hypothetical protein
MNPENNREPTAYERAGIAWWNNLSHADRARWFKTANTCIVAEAYACYLAMLEAFNGGFEELIERPFFGDEWDFGMLQS